MTIYVVLDEAGKRMVRGISKHDDLTWTTQVERALPFRYARDAYKWAAEFKELEWARVCAWESRRLDQFRETDEAA